MDPGFVCATWSNYFNVFWLFLGLCPVLGCIWAYVLSLGVFGHMPCPWVLLGLCPIPGYFWAHVFWNYALLLYFMIPGTPVAELEYRARGLRNLIIRSQHEKLLFCQRINQNVTSNDGRIPPPPLEQRIAKSERGNHFIVVQQWLANQYLQ